MQSQELYMRRALELASLGRGKVSPNPMVGCVIVKDEQIIGEGYHQQYGAAHAEVNAIASVANKSDLTGADMYVTLEPCSHHGKTPPCADLIIQRPFKKIYIANTDTNPLVAGKGIEKIKQHGIEVAVGLLENEARTLNKRFFTVVEKKRPYIVLKWAETADGFIARNDFSSQWISNDISRQIVHQWRAEEDAVLVATNTALYDNPSLTLRHWSGKQPLRVAIDKSLKFPSHLHLFDGAVPTIVYNLIKNEATTNLELVKLAGVENILLEIIQDLQNRKIQSLIVEGGSQLLQSFIALNLWDEARIFKSANTFQSGIKAPEIKGAQVYKASIKDDELRVLNNSFV